MSNDEAQTNAAGGQSALTDMLGVFDFRADELANAVIAGNAMYAELMNEKVRLEGQCVTLRAVLSALLAEANRNPFCPIGHWVEHGPCNAVLAEFAATRAVSPARVK